jgi:murein DD-endopeptidase
VTGGTGSVSISWQTEYMQQTINNLVSKVGLLRMVMVLLSLALLTGCSSALNWESSRAPELNQTLQQAADTATGMIGIPYVYGGASPKGFDCSGLVQYSYQRAGLQVPRTSRQQFAAAEPISLTSAQPGDLLFFTYNSRVSHVGIYLGDERFVHAPSTGKTVSVASLRDPHYAKHFLRAGRIY